jgi:hypothetical protein
MPVIKDAQIWYGGYDLTSTASEVSIDATVSPVAVTTFGDGGNVVNIAGLHDASASVMTFLDPLISEPALSGGLGTIDILTVSAFPTGGVLTAGDQCYAMRGFLKSDKQPMKVGEAARIDASLMGSQREGILRGSILAPSTEISATGNGTVVNLGAQTSPAVAYLGIHVFAVTGNRTVTIKLQSAAAVGFASPTDRITTGAISATGSTFATSSTATTNAFWRVTYTVGGTTGAVRLGIFAAIQ